MLPITFWHIVHAEFVVDPAFDCDGIIETLPENSVFFFFFTRFGNLKVVERENATFAVLVYESVFVSFVVDEEIFTWKSIAVMVDDQWENKILWFDYRNQRTVIIGKTKEFQVITAFAADSAGSVDNKTDGVICQHI